MPYLPRLLLMIAVLSLSAASVPAASTDHPYQLQMSVRQDGPVFVTDASFKLPLRLCQAWLYLTDYEAATAIPGILSSRTTRLGPNRARVERTIRDTILFFPIEMRTVTDFTEHPGQGTDFVQIEGKARSHRGAWRLEEDADGTTFRYHAASEPDSLLPTAVIRHFLNTRLERSFGVMADQGAKRRDIPCP